MIFTPLKTLDSISSEAMADQKKRKMETEKWKHYFVFFKKKNISILKIFPIMLTFFTFILKDSSSLTK